MYANIWYHLIDVVDDENLGLLAREVPEFTGCANPQARARRRERIPAHSGLHLRDYRNGQLRRRLPTEPRHHGLFAARKVAQHMGVEEYFTKRHLHAAAAIRLDTIRKAARWEGPATPGSAMASRGCRASSCPAIRAAPCGSTRCASRPVSWPFGPIPCRFYRPDIG